MRIVFVVLIKNYKIDTGKKASSSDTDIIKITSPKEDNAKNVETIVKSPIIETIPIPSTSKAKSSSSDVIPDVSKKIELWQNKINPTKTAKNWCWP